VQLGAKKSICAIGGRRINSQLHYQSLAFGWTDPKPPAIFATLSAFIPGHPIDLFKDPRHLHGRIMLVTGICFQEDLKRLYKTPVDPAEPDVRVPVFFFKIVFKVLKAGFMLSDIGGP
jgi:hypothetical protein